MRKSRGFTLIELLVVIAIIGILAAIVLVSLTGARTRASEARVIADLNQIRSTAELIYSNDNSYASVNCTTVANPCVCSNADITSLCTDMVRQGAPATSITFVPSANAYCVEAQLSSAGKWGCVNSSLVAIFNATSNPPCVGGASPNYSCP